MSDRRTYFVDIAEINEQEADGADALVVLHGYVPPIDPPSLKRSANMIKLVAIEPFEAVYPSDEFIEAGHVRIMWGKFRGRRLREIPIDDLVAYLVFLEGERQAISMSKEVEWLRKQVERYWLALKGVKLCLEK
jgi:hypothetical protein